MKISEKVTELLKYIEQNGDEDFNDYNFSQKAKFIKELVIKSEIKKMDKIYYMNVPLNFFSKEFIINYILPEIMNDKLLRNISQ